MNIKQIRDLALKLMGLYYLPHAVIYAPQFAGVFSLWGRVPEAAGKEFGVVVSALLPLLFWFAIGMLLTFRTALVAAWLWSSSPEESQAYATARPSLRFWIVLIGFFYFVGALGGTVSQVWMLTAGRGMRGSFPYYRSLPQLITLVLSVVCIVGAGRIEGFLMGKIKNDDQQSPGGDSSTPADAGRGAP